MQELPKGLTMLLRSLDACAMEYMAESLAEYAAKLSGKGRDKREQLLDAFADAFARAPQPTLVAMAQFCFEATRRKGSDIAATEKHILALWTRATRDSDAMEASLTD